jgi:hypothetical protein
MDTRKTAFVLVVTLLAGVLLQPSAALATEAAAESTSVAQAQSDWLSLFLGVNCGLGSYKNIIRRQDNLSDLVKIDPFAWTVYGEAGLEVFSLRIGCDLSFVTTIDYIADDDSVQKAYSFTKRIKGVYAVRKEKYHLYPEAGCVFLSEDVLIFETPSDGPNHYKESYKDQGFYYGLSARVRVIRGVENHWWLYARYTHDNLDIQEDSYQLEFQGGGEYSRPSVPGDVYSEIKYVYIGLGVKWSKKSDGRSAWFITIGLSDAFRLLQKR